MGHVSNGHSNAHAVILAASSASRQQRQTISDFEVDSSTSADGTFDVDANAAPGPRDVTFTSSDGDSSTCSACFTVDSPPTIGSVTPDAVGQGASNASVVIDGNSFNPDADVSVTGAAVDQETVVSASEIDLVIAVPTSTLVGEAAITVDNGDGGTATTSLKIDAKRAANVLTTST